MSVIVLGASALQARLGAVSAMASSGTLMAKVGLSAVREQKLMEAKHRKTGITGASIRLGTVTPTSALTMAGGAAAYLEFGTRPHEISPKTAKVLAWAQGPAGGAFRRLSGATRKGVSSANIIFAMKVHHPGTKPSPFMVPGAILGIQNAGLADMIVAAWDSVP